MSVRACIAALKQCASSRDLEAGRDLHSTAVHLGFDTNKFVATALVTLYSKCANMWEARAVFDRVIHPDVILHNSLILGYVENRKYVLAIELFMLMDCPPDSVTFMAGLKAYAGLACENLFDQTFCLEKGIVIHKLAKERGLANRSLVASSLMEMYKQCGSITHARSVFNRLQTRDVVAWTNVIWGHTENGEGLVAMELYSCMDCEPDSVTFVAILKTCSSLQSELHKAFCLNLGIAVHERLTVLGLGLDIFVASAAIDMYRKLGAMRQARAIFDGMVSRSVVPWNSLIQGYVENGGVFVALDLFASMDCKPDSCTVVAVLKACSWLERYLEDRRFCLEMGTGLHRRIQKLGLESHVFVASSLVEMYIKCGSLRHAKAVFDSMEVRDVVSWNVLLLGYVENGGSLSAMELVTWMECEPNTGTFVAALKACLGLISTGFHKLFCLEKGMVLHRKAIDRGLDEDVLVANALLGLYSRCGCLRHAQATFDMTRHPDVVSWTHLMFCYVEHGDSLVAMELFTSMDCEPSSFTLVAALRACGRLGAVAAGRRIHAQISKLGLESNRVVANCLVDFYVKFGNMAVAERVFSRMSDPDVVSWNALIAGYSLLGETDSVLYLMNEMHASGVEMDDVTLVLLLANCSHKGMVDESREYFERIVREYDVATTMEHYACIVDMLGRANRLEEALSVIRSMPFEANGVVWTSLAGACRKWNNLEVGKVAVDALLGQRDRDVTNVC